MFKLKLGKRVELLFEEKDEEGNKKKRWESRKVEGIYPHHVRLVNSVGVSECYILHEIREMMAKGVIKECF